MLKIFGLVVALACGIFFTANATQMSLTGAGVGTKIIVAQTSFGPLSAGSDNTGNAGTTFRNAPAPALTTTGGNFVRVTFQACASNVFSVGHASIGIQLVTSTTTATPVELLFSGASGFSMTAAQADLTSDWMPLVTTNGQILMPIIDLTSSCVNRIAGQSYLQTSTTSYNSATCAGCSSNAFYYGIRKIEIGN